MALEIIIPSPGESITEAELASWFVEDGALVQKNQEIGEIESEKATLPLIAEQAGKISLKAEAGSTVNVGDVVAIIDTGVEVPADAGSRAQAPAEGPASTSEETAPAPEETAPVPEKPSKVEKEETDSRVKVTPVARKIMEEEQISLEEILSGLRKITAADVRKFAGRRSELPDTGGTGSREAEKKKVSQLRKKISERLVAVKNETAMLTTFNEADMSAVIRIRKENQEKFMETHGVKLGFMSFFTKAVCEALSMFPAVNSFLENDMVVLPEYCDVGIAVQTDKGLMVPVIRNAESKGLATLEKEIGSLAAKARKARLGIEEMTGGTFTISNGGIYGSMLSTPILNPPQSGILGLHNILERPVAVNGKVEIRPMMYLALSYDHRLIDGKDSVGFLKAVKEFIEDPVKLLFGDRSSEEYLLEL